MQRKTYIEFGFTNQDSRMVKIKNRDQLQQIKIPKKARALIMFDVFEHTNEHQGKKMTLRSEPQDSEFFSIAQRFISKREVQKMIKEMPDHQSGWRDQLKTLLQVTSDLPGRFVVMDKQVISWVPKGGNYIFINGEKREIGKVKVA